MNTESQRHNVFNITFVPLRLCSNSIMKKRMPVFLRNYTLLTSLSNSMPYSLLAPQLPPNASTVVALPRIQSK